MASYSVSYRVAQVGEAHTTAENLIKPCVKDIVECMLDGKATELVGTIRLSNKTILRLSRRRESYFTFTNKMH